MTLSRMGARFVLANRKTKSPVNPLTGYDSNAQDASTWMTYAVATGWAAARGPEYGVGVVISEGCGYAAIDIDGALQADGTWSLLALSLMQLFKGSYIETSVSGRGLHIIFSVSGTIPEHRTKNTILHIEAYSRSRYILLGSDASGDPQLIQNDAFYATLAEHFVAAPSATSGDWTTEPNATWDGPADDDELIQRALSIRPSAASVFGKRASFADLWYAREDKLAVAFPAQSHGKTYDGSSADLALANHLGFWAGGDCERMLRLMQRSALAREKWNREDYLRSTITRAAIQSSYYRQRVDDGRRVDDSASVPVDSPPVQLVVESALELNADGVPLPPVAAIPPPPTSLALLPPATERGSVVSTLGQKLLWDGCAYVEDIHMILSADGILLDQKRFDVRYGGREFVIDAKRGGAPESSAWNAFTDSKDCEFPQVRGTLFSPLLPSGLTVIQDGLKFINVYKPIEIRTEPGDVSLFTNHLEKLYPKDWRILLNYLKFMVQHKGKKSKWWPFLQGVPGNGKSFISTTMQYCIGKRYTQKPTPKNIDSQFNASLYACLFVALEDVKVADDYGALWETLKPMITEDSIEIQPKGVDKVTREIRFNGILNSNHKDGIRKERDDRRIAPFFAAQQQKADLERDGLTSEYFSTLWNWAQADGWAHVAHYLATDPIDDEYNPSTQCMVAPITSSTEEAIELSLGIVEQTLLDRARAGEAGFKNGWVNMRQFELLARALNKRLAPSKLAGILGSMGYVPHPGLTNGRLPIKLTDGTLTTLYVLHDHSSSRCKDAAKIKQLYETGQT